MNDALKILIEARRGEEMSNLNREAQRPSLAYGATPFENDLIGGRLPATPSRSA